MKIDLEKPYGLIYLIVNHPHLGYLLEPHMVQISPSGKYSMTHQRIFVNSIETYQKAIDQTDQELISILQELDPETIIRPFNRGLIRPNLFFQKEFKPDIFKNQIRPKIEKIIWKALPLLKDKPLFILGKDEIPASSPVKIAEEKATILFHFRRNEEGTNYFPTIKCQNEKVDFRGKNGILLCSMPAILINEGILYTFTESIEAAKLKPFLEKQFIHIPARTEADYFSKFIAPLLQRFDVYAEGFDIKEVNVEPVAQIAIETALSSKVMLSLQFLYDKKAFQPAARQQTFVDLETDGNQYTLKRIPRKKEKENEIIEWFLQNGLRLEVSGLFVIDPYFGYSDMVVWLNDHAEIFKEKGIIIKENKDGNYHLAPPSISFTAVEGVDWFDLNADAVFGDIRMPFKSLIPFILAKKREVKLPNGQLALLPDEWLTRLAEVLEYRKDGTDGLRLRRVHMPIIESFANSSVHLPINKNLFYDEVPKMSTGFSGELRPYQAEGFKWLYRLNHLGFGGILADDMGLGKTIQTLALLCKIRDEAHLVASPLENSQLIKDSDQRKIQNTNLARAQEKQNKPSQKKKKQINLLIVPTSLVYNWLKEFQKFAPHLKVTTHFGINRPKRASSFNQQDVVITTYGVMRSDVDMLSKILFHYIIIDEGQAIKNPASLTTKALNQLQSDLRLVLTGTPIENSITDLWSQMNFANPGLLGNWSSFQKRFVFPIEKNKDEAKTQLLYQMIQPFILRRTKTQVASDLPDKYEQVIYCEMTDEQQKRYEKIKSSFRNEILQSVQSNGINKASLQLLKGLMLLRQIANHPRLINPDEIAESGKFENIINMLQTAIDEGHKVLLFSQFTKHLALFKQHLQSQQIAFAYLDGATTIKARQQQVDDFNQNPDLKIFLISLKAGGIGLNLTSADYVFIADPWWNPASEQQAIDRAHRIGQQQKVFSYKFITRNSIEEKILNLQQKKLELAGSLIKTDESFFKNLDLVELQELLD